MRSLLLPPLLLAACAGDPNTIEVSLAPSVISSLDGRTTISALVAADTTPLDDTSVHVEIAYTDRNGIPHAFPAMDGKTDARGVYTKALEGLAWDGTGKISVTAGAASGDATFSVLDRTPPKIEILPPTTDKHVGPGLPLDVQIHVTDEIGISQVIFDGTGNITGARSTVVASGTTDTVLTFRTSIPAGATAGPSIELHALASDLSGNFAAAVALTLTVDPAITIATPPGLSGSLLADGTTTLLVSPRAIVVSPMDGHLYVADVNNTGLCAPSCVWRVDAVSGAIDATPVYVGTGALEGIALDSTGANLYLSDRPNKITQLTWSGSAYTGAVTCDDTSQQRPQDPYHLVFDATLGMLAVDGNRKELERVATCSTSTIGTAASVNGNFDTPRGVALGPSGEIYLSDQNRGRVSKVDRTTGAVTAFENGIDGAYGMEWLAGGTSAFANTLLVAAGQARVVEGTKGMGTLAAAYLRNTPIDVALSAGGTLYILTSPSSGNRGRIYAVGGF